VGSSHHADIGIDTGGDAGRTVPAHRSVDAATVMIRSARHVMFWRAMA
jgi:hypothetical protein